MPDTDTKPAVEQISDLITEFYCKHNDYALMVIAHASNNITEPNLRLRTILTQLDIAGIEVAA
jgi:hypothetical protein